MCTAYSSGSQGRWSQSQLNSGERQGTPWAGHQSVKSEFLFLANIWVKIFKYFLAPAEQKHLKTTTTTGNKCQEEQEQIWLSLYIYTDWFSRASYKWQPLQSNISWWFRLSSGSLEVPGIWTDNLVFTRPEPQLLSKHHLIRRAVKWGQPVRPGVHSAYYSHT